MLASGAHVKIGTKEFRLAIAEDAPYTYSLTPVGEDILYWLLDDWQGGEGNDVFDPNDDTVYHQGLVNPRLPGLLTTPPTRASASTAALTPAPTIALHASAGGRLYTIGEATTAGANSYWYTSNLTSYTELADAGWDAAIDYVSAVATDGVNVYVAGFGTAASAIQIRKIVGKTGTLSDLQVATAQAFPAIGMGVLGDYVYWWTGEKLRYRSIAGSAGSTTAYTTGVDLTSLTWGTDYWGGTTSGGGSLFHFQATEGVTTVYETKLDGSTYDMWRMPAGFTGKAITYQSGAVLVCGEYLGEGALFGMSASTYQPLFLSYIRLGDGISPEVMNSGYGDEVIIAEKSWASPGGLLFIYDLALDQLSQLDIVTHTSGECYSVGSYLGKRIAVVEDGSDVTVYNWDTDDTPSTSVDGRMESGVWDFDVPEEEKQLDGFHVISDANATKTVQVYYQDDEDGTWTSAGTASTGFHNYLQVSDGTTTEKFRALRVRVDPKTGATVYSVTARVRVNTYQETWELLLDLTDESIDSTTFRRGYEDKGWQLRDYIRDIADDKTVVTFLDGMRYPQSQGDDPDKYTTHTVIVDIPVDRIDKPGEGKMLVRLRSVAVN